MSAMHDEAAYAAGTDSEPTSAWAEPPSTPEPAVVTALASAGPVDARLASREARRRAAGELFGWLKTLASAAVYATFIVTFVGQAARVEGSSMLPTLHDQDRLIVNKLAYRWHIPEVGDIVMVASPQDPDLMLVKRVVAGPGDTLQSLDGRLYRNGSLVRDSFVPRAYRSDDTWGPETVPIGDYFVMGDHRNDSADSRMFGPVPEKYIIGKVEVRWWPVPNARIF
jgi:signal peptidase I